jgi:hypothetical protein
MTMTLKQANAMLRHVTRDSICIATDCWDFRRGNEMDIIWTIYFVSRNRVTGRFTGKTLAEAVSAALAGDGVRLEPTEATDRALELEPGPAEPSGFADLLRASIRQLENGGGKDGAA